MQQVMNTDEDYSYQRQDFIFLIAWMLQRKLLIRMHQYINYIGDGSNSSILFENIQISIINSLISTYYTRSLEHQIQTTLCDTDICGNIQKSRFPTPIV